MRKFSESLPMLLLQARETTMEFFRPILVAKGLTEQQWRVIRALYELEECTAQALAQTSCILSPSLSRIIGKMIDEGYVLRRVPGTDQRKTLLRLSKKGLRLHDKVGFPIEEKYQEIQAKLNGEKLETLYDLLADLAKINDPL